MSGVSSRGMDLMRKLARGVDSMPNKVLAVTSEAVGVAFLKEVADGFRKSVDPYDEPWKPLKRDRARNIKGNARRARAGKAPKASKVLIDTGRLRNSAAFEVSYSAKRDALRIFLPVEYASYHQEGTKHNPQRMMLPDPSQGLGPRWTKAANKAGKAAADAIVKGVFAGIK